MGLKRDFKNKPLVFRLKRPKTALQQCSSSKTFPLVRILVVKVQTGQRCRNTCWQRCVRSVLSATRRSRFFGFPAWERCVCVCVNKSHLSRLFEHFNKFRFRKSSKVSLLGTIISQIPPHQAGYQFHPIFFSDSSLGVTARSAIVLGTLHIKVHLYVMLTPQQ